MTQTIIRPGFRDDGGGSAPDFVPNGGRVPRLSGDIRHLIPKLGLREYWYPLCGAGRVPKKKAIRVRMLGEDLCVFRGRERDQVYALTDICPHRGARLSEGDCHYDGTIACPYHGWVWDGKGRNVAVLSEGPNSIVCGKPGTEARAYPTKVLKGIVFVWMGDGEPAPIEEDVPEEFFEPKTVVFFNDHIYWKTNWEVALENSMDSHVQYLHRDNLQALLNDGSVRSGGSSGQRPIFTGNGFRSGNRPLQGPRPVATQDVYANSWKWPKHTFRHKWGAVFAPFMFMMRVQQPVLKDPELWVAGHHLPGLFRAGGSAQTPPKPRDNLLAQALNFRGGGGLFGLYTRQVVPVDEWLTRVWYHHSTVPKNVFQRLWFGLVYFTWGRWAGEYNFSQQDMSVMLNQLFDAPEKLSGTDAEIVQWRKLIVTKHFGGRNHPFEYANPEPLEQTAPASSTR
jgi:phenylpropionate dioxygenase-like ring-hydroxylating dioxygenase large terminal subunit